MRIRNDFIFCFLFVISLFIIAFSKYYNKKDNNFLKIIYKITGNKSGFKNKDTLVFFITPYFDCFSCGSFYITSKKFIKKIFSKYENKIEINYIVFGSSEDIDKKDHFFKNKLKYFYITTAKEELYIKGLLKMCFGIYKTPALVFVKDNQVVYIKQFVASKKSEKERNFLEIFNMLEVLK